MNGIMLCLIAGLLLVFGRAIFASIEASVYGWRAARLRAAARRRLERAARDKAAFMARRGYANDEELTKALREAEAREARRRGVLQ